VCRSVFPPERLRILALRDDVPTSRAARAPISISHRPKDKRSLVHGQQCPLEPVEGAARENCRVLKYAPRRGGECASLRLSPQRTASIAQLRLPDQTIELRQDEYTPGFPGTSPPSIHRKTHARFSPFGTATERAALRHSIQIRPGHPALPISNPLSYSLTWQAARAIRNPRVVAEDTSALNESVIGEDAFLSQSQDIHQERERCFRRAQEDRREPSCASFDINDGSSTCSSFHKTTLGGSWRCRYAHVLRDLYVQMTTGCRVMKEIARKQC